MKKGKTGWLILFILSSIVTSCTGLPIIVMLFFGLLLCLFMGNGTIDGQSFSWNVFTQHDIEMMVAMVLSGVSALFSYKKYKE
jgi:hypothetical protein